MWCFISYDLNINILHYLCCLSLLKRDSLYSVIDASMMKKIVKTIINESFDKSITQVKHEGKTMIGKKTPV